MKLLVFLLGKKGFSSNSVNIPLHNYELALVVRQSGLFASVTKLLGSKTRLWSIESNCIFGIFLVSVACW
jgi:hypothetical protein